MTPRAGWEAKVVTDSDPTGPFVASPFVRSALHGDRTILLDLQHERYYGLDEVGTRVWALLGESVGVPAIIARLGEEYDVPREQLETDVTEVLRYLSDLKVIIPARFKQNRVHIVSAANSEVSCTSLRRLRAPSGLSCALALVGATIALRVLGLRRSLALAQQLARRPPAGQTPGPELLANVVRKVDTAAAFFPGRALCLEQSLALYLCLRLAGVQAELRIGVQPYPFTAHAWVEYRGEAVGESYDRVGKFVSFGDLEVPGCSSQS